MKNKILFFLLLVTTGCIALVGLVSWTNKSSEPRPDAKVLEAAVLKGFGLLQTSGALFVTSAHCASCHHTTMTSMIAGTLEKKGLASADTTKVLRQMAEIATLDIVGNPNLNNQFVPAKFIIPYVLLGLAAEQHAPDFSTDISVDYIASLASPDGRFPAEYARVPLEYGDIHLTALSVRAIALYAPQMKSARVQSVLARSKKWLEDQHTTDQQELAFQLMGLQWSGSNPDKKISVGRQLAAMQNSDGGWSQLPTMQSDAYATGQSLYALLESGTFNVDSEPCVKAINYLMKNQDITGAWIVKTRSSPIQPFVNSNFPPYDDNQFISAAASNWATLALATALPDKK